MENQNDSYYVQKSINEQIKRGYKKSVTPDASYVASYSSWEKQFGRHVKRGEKGIRIIAPSPYRTTRIRDKPDPQTMQPIVGSDGKPLKEKYEVVIPAYKVVTVFDYSQTEGRELPQITNDLHGSVNGYKELMTALSSASPVPIEYAEMTGMTHGYYDLANKKIVISSGMSEEQTVKTCIHEMAHALLHDKESGMAKEVDRKTMEVQAESVAYTCCQHFGIDSSEYSFGYIAGWSGGKDPSELKSSLETIRKASSRIISGTEEQLLKNRENAAEIIKAGPRTIDGHQITRKTTSPEPTKYKSQRKHH